MSEQFFGIVITKIVKLYKCKMYNSEVLKSLSDKTTLNCSD